MHTANYLESSGVIEGGQVGWMGARVGERAGGGGGTWGREDYKEAVQIAGGQHGLQRTTKSFNQSNKQSIQEYITKSVNVV